MFCIDATLMKARVSAKNPEKNIAGREVAISRHALIPPFGPTDTLVYVHYNGWSYKVPFTDVQPINETPVAFAKAS